MTGPETPADGRLAGKVALVTGGGSGSAKPSGVAWRTWLAEGRLIYRETIVDGLERTPEALIRMLTGDMLGKTPVRVAEPTVAK